MSPDAQFRWMGIGFAGQQSLRILGGAVRDVAELDPTKISHSRLYPLGTLRDLC